MNWNWNKSFFDWISWKMGKIPENAICMVTLTVEFECIRIIWFEKLFTNGYHWLNCIIGSIHSFFWDRCKNVIICYLLGQAWAILFIDLKSVVIDLFSIAHVSNWNIEHGNNGRTTTTNKNVEGKKKGLHIIASSVQTYQCLLFTFGRKNYFVNVPSQYNPFKMRLFSLDFTSQKLPLFTFYPLIVSVSDCIYFSWKLSKHWMFSGNAEKKTKMTNWYVLHFDIWLKRRLGVSDDGNNTVDSDTVNEMIEAIDRSLVISVYYKSSFANGDSSMH